MSEIVSLQAIKERLGLLEQQSELSPMLRKSLRKANDLNSKQESDMRNVWLGIMIERGFESCVKFLLDVGTDVNGTNTNFRDLTPIEETVQWGKYSMAEILLDYGAKFRNTDLVTFDTPDYNAGASLLWAAARYNLMSLAIKVLDHGFPVNAPDEIGTPLCEALYRQHIDIATFLLDRGASINYDEEVRVSPLTVAAKCGTLETVSMLLERGADLNWESWNGNEALSAAIPNNEPVARFLISKGHKVTPRHLRFAVRKFPKTSVSFIELLADKAGNSDDALDSRVAALNVAAEAGLEELVKIFLDKGVKPKTLNLEAISNGHISIVKALLSAGADPNTVSEEKGNSLYRAASIGSIELVELLLDKGVPIDSISGKCRRAVMVAAFYGNLELFDFLRSRGAQTITDEEGDWGSAFDAAMKGGQKQMLHIFKDYGEFRIPEDSPVQRPNSARSSSTGSVMLYFTDLVD